MKKRYLLSLVFIFLSYIAFSAPQFQDTTVHLIRMNLYGFNTDGSIFRLDGTFAQYADNYSNDIDGEDGRKMINPGINVCLLRNNINLVVERRHTIASDDTLFFRMWGLQRKAYLMKFVGVNLGREGLQAWLEDSYLHTTQPVNLNDTTNIKIEINSDPSSSSNDRFRLVFKMQEVPVVHFTAITNQQILLNWSGRNTDSIEKYWIQRSFNGTDFTDIGTLAAPGSLSQNYQWADPFPTAGFNYYRIKSLQNTGKVTFSNTIITKLPEVISSSIVLYPNPAKGDNLNLKMQNQPPGKYLIKIFNSFGQEVMQNSFNFGGGAGIQKIGNNNQLLVPGIYHLQILKPNGDKQALEVIF